MVDDPMWSQLISPFAIVTPNNVVVAFRSNRTQQCCCCFPSCHTLSYSSKKGLSSVEGSSFSPSLTAASTTSTVACLLSLSSASSSPVEPTVVGFLLLAWTTNRTPYPPWLPLPLVCLSFFLL
ncbi:hypothetical protein BHE74_00012223 [Ensete ventricosum]|nr:hypothetical protein BHE74_00012223 [Ensete ventricosum]